LHGLEDQAVEIVGTALQTDTEATFKNRSNISLVGFDMSKSTAEEVYKKTGYSPQDV